MRKRVVSVLLSLVMAFSLAACDAETTGMSEDASKQNANSGNVGTSVEDDKAGETVVEPNAERVSRPKDVTATEEENLTYEEKTAWTAYLIDAYQNLDFDVMEEFLLPTDADHFEGMKRAMEKEENVEFFKKTVGQMIYFPEYDVLVYKDPYYFLAKAYEEYHADTSQIGLRQTNEEDEEQWGNWCDITLEFANEIYDKYWDEAPYIHEWDVSRYMFGMNDGKPFSYFVLVNRMGWNDYVYSIAMLTQFAPNSKGDAKPQDINYSGLLFGAYPDMEGYWEMSIPKGAYTDVPGGLYDEEVPKEVLEDGEKLLEAYGGGWAEREFLEYAPDDSNRQAMIKSYNEECIVVMSAHHTLVYQPAEANKGVLFKASDGTIQGLDDHFYELCKEKGIVLYHQEMSSSSRWELIADEAIWKPIAWRLEEKE